MVPATRDEVPLHRRPPVLLALAVARLLVLVRRSLAERVPGAAGGTWPAGWQPSRAAEPALIAAIGPAALAVASRRFARPE
ncbi:hypothetical protein [Streptomyces sp. NPDC008001]|uniref:hypothetical protein n=1 Tax=Streptomyces sp. NPDC008001 TaxID=3364804 RepID=UPI0036E78F1A